MFFVITNIYNKETKGPILMELFTVTGKLKKVFFLTTREVRCVHTSIRYSSSCHTRFNMGAFCLNRHPGSLNCLHHARMNGLVCGRVLCVLCTKCTLHSNHRLTRVIFQHTKRLLPPKWPFSHYVHSHRLAAEM